jgi:heat-inducible transcriptional repressor
MAEKLTERERTILRNIVHNYILTATPVGSRWIAKELDIGLSPATIRNVMADLEFMGYLDHPHPSAGRMPTDRGYRFYVDSLMEIEHIQESDQESIQQILLPVEDPEEVLRESSKILGRISHQLSIITSPHFASGVFEKLELIALSSSKIMVVISLKAGLVKTITMEVLSEIRREKLDELSSMMNERLSGLTLSEIRNTFVNRMKDISGEHTGLVRLFIDSIDKLFNDVSAMEKVHIGGTRDILTQPEFEHPENFRSIIELLDNQQMIIHVLEKNDMKIGGVNVSIGAENIDEALKNYSILTTGYSISDVNGSVCVIGPKRMNYSKVVPLVDYIARTISSMLSYR